MHSIPLKAFQATPDFMVETIHYSSTWLHRPLTPPPASAERRPPLRWPPPRGGYMSPSTCHPPSPSTSRIRRLLPRLLPHRNAERSSRKQRRARAVHLERHSTCHPLSTAPRPPLDCYHTLGDASPRFRSTLPMYTHSHSAPLSRRDGWVGLEGRGNRSSKK